MAEPSLRVARARSEFLDAAGAALGPRGAEIDLRREDAVAEECGYGEEERLAWLSFKTGAYREAVALGCGRDSFAGLLVTAGVGSAAAADALERRVRRVEEPLAHAVELAVAARVLGYRWDADGRAVRAPRPRLDVPPHPEILRYEEESLLHFEPGWDQLPGEHRIAAAERAATYRALAAALGVEAPPERAPEPAAGGAEERPAEDPVLVARATERLEEERGVLAAALGELRRAEEAARSIDEDRKRAAAAAARAMAARRALDEEKVRRGVCPACFRTVGDRAGYRCGRGSHLAVCGACFERLVRRVCPICRDERLDVWVPRVLP